MPRSAKHAAGGKRGTDGLLTHPGPFGKNLSVPARATATGQQKRIAVFAEVRGFRQFLLRGMEAETPVGRL